MLWPRIAVILLLLAAYAWLEVRALPQFVPVTNRATAVSSLLSVLLPIALYVLVAFAIFEEPLPGDRQFWLTRPYRRLSLFGSKLLFVAAFINLPLFLSDCYILGAQQLPVLGVLPNLLLRQLFLTVLFVVPPFAMATITKGLPQFLLGWFILALALICETQVISILTPRGVTFLIDNSGLYWVFAIACGTTLWQYLTRQTFTSRVALFGAVAGSLLIPAFSSAFLTFGKLVAQRPNPPGSSNIQIAYDPDAVPTHVPGYPPGSGQSAFLLPLKIAGLPPGTLLRAGGVLEIEIAGKRWPNVSTSLEKRDNGYVQRIELESDVANTASRQPVDLKTRFDFAVVTDTIDFTVPASTERFFASGVGRCRTFQVPQPQQVLLDCRAGLEPSVDTDVQLVDSLGDAKFVAVFGRKEIPWGLSPVSEQGSGPIPGVHADSKFAFIPRHEVTQFHRTLELHHISLRDR